MMNLRRYALLMTWLGGVLRLILLWRSLRGAEVMSRRGERMGRASQVAFDDGRPVWLHAVSVGELMSVLPLIERLKSEGVNVLVTTSTKGSLDLVAKRLPQGVVHQMFPFDRPAWIDRFLNHWQPSLALFTESEIWPNHFQGLSKRSIPLVLINARLSQKSVRQWQKSPQLQKDVFALIDKAYAQEEAYQAPLEAFGVEKVTFLGNLKLDAKPLPADEAQLDLWRKLKGDRIFIVAASIHLGEESLILSVFSLLNALNRKLVLCLVPRHPDKADEMIKVAKVFCETFEKIETFSTHGVWSGKSSVWVDDTFGRLGLFYRLADQVWLGGSWIAKGGHNPIEPLIFQVPVLHGPSYENFATLYPSLGKACHEAKDYEELLITASSCLIHADKAKEAAIASMDVIKRYQGGTERLLADLKANWPDVFQHDDGAL